MLLMKQLVLWLCLVRHSCGLYTRARRPLLYGERKILKAKRDAGAYLFTRESYKEFPDLRYSNSHRKSFEKRSAMLTRSNLNSRWVMIELSNGRAPSRCYSHQPEDFDSQSAVLATIISTILCGLQRATLDAPLPPVPSSIFLLRQPRLCGIFIPTSTTRPNYPGRVLWGNSPPGYHITSGQGFHDRGASACRPTGRAYQSAYLITPTNLFRCAESGAPVVNMTSSMAASAGVRAEFLCSQYERTQSRIGGTLWEKPQVHRKLSLFADRIETPVLILHNDETTAPCPGTRASSSFRSAAPPGCF